MKEILILILLIIIAFVLICYISDKIRREKNNGELKIIGGVEQLFSLGIPEPWLYHIQTGKKDIITRLGPKGKYDYLKGKMIRLYNKNRSIPAEIVGIRYYSSVKEFLKAEGLKRTTPWVEDISEAVELYREFYIGQNTNTGIAALELKLDVLNKPVHMPDLR
jgi:ASC-1-like (ASCH) protein